MSDHDEGTTRRRFLSYFSSIGLSSTLLPGVLWANVQRQLPQRVDATMLEAALAVSGLEFTAEERQTILSGVNANLERFESLRELRIADHIAPPFSFNPIVPGTRIDRVRRRVRMSPPPSVKRPASRQDLAFWPVRHLARLLETRQITSVELTEMYLARLREHDPRLNCVVTLTDALAMEQATQADRAIASGRYRGPLHGIPWGCKDIIAVPGYPTTWGSETFRDQTIETEATVVRLLREAGAVLVAKLSTGELAGGDRWFGGRTNNPWNPSDGAEGSSAGSASATAAGLVGFAIGTETGDSILRPASACGVTGLRPTFGRVSRYGSMTLSWTRDTVGPLCRTAEDCAMVLHVLASSDERDPSVMDLPFNWDAERNVRRMRIGYLESVFAERSRSEDRRANDQETLAQLRSLGVTLEPFQLPELPLGAISGLFGAEAGAFFDEFLRTGRDKQLADQTRADALRQSRLIPAVEYLQAQRVRALIMQKYFEATDRFDAYVAPYTNTPTTISEHYQVTSLCGYPAVSVPNGFTSDGKPTSITFVGSLYGEASMLALARAYQEATAWHQKRPTVGRLVIDG